MLGTLAWLVSAARLDFNSSPSGGRSAGIDNSAVQPADLKLKIEDRRIAALPQLYLRSELDLECGVASGIVNEGDIRISEGAGAGPSPDAVGQARRGVGRREVDSVLRRAA